MKKEIRFAINPGWRILINDLGINPIEVLKAAKLPVDLFNRRGASLCTHDYYSLWYALEFIFDDPTFPLRIVRGLSSEAFDPPIFAIYCSPNLNTSLKRLSQFKPLIGPMKLEVQISESATKMTIHFLQKDIPIPTSLIATELGFFVQMARMATRDPIIPQSVVTPNDLPSIADYTAFFGVKPTRANEISLSFSSQDAAKPFVTENTPMWNFFEPELRKRLSEIQADEAMNERVRAALLEMLPSGQSSVDDVAARLLVSRRTLQRRLGEQNTSFKAVLSGVREELARHYITQSELPYTQISFLLGYEDPNSFFRAFHHWTGTTPDAVRSQPKH